MKKEHILWPLKTIGILLFVWILQRIEYRQLLAVFRTAHPTLIADALLCIIGIYIAKTLRWRALVHAAGLKLLLSEAWRMYAIGIFLGNITPGKVGELGKAAYLHKKGLPMKIGMLLSIVDRAADGIVILVFGTAGLGILGGIEWALLGYAALILLAVVGIMVLLRRRLVRLALPLVKFFLHHAHPHLMLNIVLSTLLGWLCYLLWAVLLARSLDITVEVPILVAVFTLTGLVSMLPIAPNGLGTRDAALIFLLAPYGVQIEQAVAQALLMFTTTLLMSILGGWYWFRSY